MPAAPMDPTRLTLLAQLQRRQGIIGHELVALHLKSCGVTHVYGVSGEPIDQTLAACGKHGLRVIATRHQQAAVLAAAAHNYFAGSLNAAVIVSSGPAVSNCTTGLTVARDNHWPVLVIGGCRSTAMRGMGAFQDLDGARLFKSITKHSAAVADPQTLGRQIDQSCRLTLQGQPGPCYLDVAEEALNGSGFFQQLGVSADRPSPPVDWGEVILAFTQAHRPVLIIGEDLRWGDPWASLIELVEHLRLPFVTSPNAHGFLPDRHARNGTDVRSWLLGEADVVLIAGASLNWVFRHGAEVRPEALVIRLGYGSDPVLQTRNRHLEIQGHPADLVRQLTILLRDQGNRPPANEPWEAALARQKQMYRLRLTQMCRDEDLPFTPACWLVKVAGALPTHAITILDGNVVMAWAQLLLPVDIPVARLTAGANGCMGSGLPFALAASAARPDLPVVAVCGDFALGVNIMDLETAVRHQLPLVIIVSNNNGSGGRLRQQAYWPSDSTDLVCQFTPGIRYDLIMQAVGGEGVFIETIEQVAPALARAISLRQPTLIQIETRDDIPLPRL